MSLIKDQDQWSSPPSKSSPSKLAALRSKAFIPDQLPDDFLRITLDRNQKAGHQRHQYQQQRPQQLVMNNAYGMPFGYPVQQLAARGRLQIHLFEAKLNKNYGFINKMDLYVKINVNGKILQTETDYSAGKNPKWNKAIACFIPHGVDSLILEIFDERTLSSDEQIAMIHYVFPDELFTGTPVDEWFPLNGKLGEQKEGNIHLRLQFTPIDNVYRERPVTNRVVRPPVAEYTETPQPVEIKKEDVEAIKEMFPTYEEDVIRSLMETNEGDKVKTINMMLQMANDG